MTYFINKYNCDQQALAFDVGVTHLKCGALCMCILRDHKYGGYMVVSQLL